MNTVISATFYQRDCQQGGEREGGGGGHIFKRYIVVNRVLNT